MIHHYALFRQTKTHAIKIMQEAMPNEVEND